MSVVINPGFPVVYVETDGSDSHTQVANNAWEDWDLSAVIPANVIAVDIRTAANITTKGIRTNGSVMVRTSNGAPLYARAIPDVNRIIETYGMTNDMFYLWGYWI